MNAVRAFIAVELPKVTRDALSEVQARLGQHAPRGSVRWVKPDNIHLTLKFLGQVPTAQIEAISLALRRAVSVLHVFPFDVMRVGCFPDAQRPRVIWVGIDEPSGALHALQRAVESATVPLGYPTEPRPFQPHLTLGRTGRDLRPADLHKLGEAVMAAKIGLIGHVHADEIVLFQSELAPSGSIYTVLARFPLAH
ncbi:MAG TPA: RNA 2',3'-cyclic phosphodiesterase [Anaerolineae bacterium]|nr:RNA 2',3'-cyclic phosphodiesterase [Anaerolineae bacterium]